MLRQDKRLLKVFLCHASGDKPPVRDLYKRLTEEGVDAWLDKEKLLPGQDWRLEIPKAVQDADVVVVCLSNKSITKEGYVQKEIKFALDIAEEKPEGAIFLIPARLEDCPVPERLSRWQWVDLYEENGFVQLLRSLKLRALAVGAAVEPASYVDSDQESERRLDQLYTEGLAAFYTEDWDRACHRFQSILSEYPNHRNAAEKLAEAERQRDLERLYEQAGDAVRTENWHSAIKILEELSQKSTGYKDVAQLLGNARKQKQLRELYTEAGKLHAAQKWQAVVKVFEQITIIEPSFPDIDGFLVSAQKEVAEIKRIDGLNNQYSHALRAMDAGNWYEARQLLETVHKSQTGFLETEKLLRKVENEISREEENRRQNDQINTLYEQAHGLLRSKKWRNALEKMEEIGRLDEHFPDADGIVEKAQKEIASEEQEAERQNQLAAMYAEAVRLLKEEKYQEALEKWQEVKVVDPKYPDRQWVQRTAKRRLTYVTKPILKIPKFAIKGSPWLRTAGIIAAMVIMIGIVFLKSNLPLWISTPTQNNMIKPTFTTLPFKTTTPRSATSNYSDPTLYDEFDDFAYDGSYNKLQWDVWTSDNKSSSIIQESGKVIIVANAGQRVWFINHVYNDVKIEKPVFFETKMKLDGLAVNSDMLLTIRTDYGAAHCGPENYGFPDIQCWRNFFSERNDDGSVGIYLGSWHTLRLEIDPLRKSITSFIDGQTVQSYMPPNPDTVMMSKFLFAIELNNWSNAQAKGFIDYVKIGEIEE